MKQKAARPEPYEYKNIDELHSALKRLMNDHRLEKWVNEEKRGKTFEDDMILMAVGVDTFRPLKRIGGKSPLTIFRDWAKKQIDVKTKTVKGIDCNLTSRTDFDEWNEELSNDLAEYSKHYVSDDVLYAKCRKPIDLLLKRLLLWFDADKTSRQKLIQNLHVPWDSFTLAAIRNCIDDDLAKIPKRAKMGFVDSKMKYEHLLIQVRKICDEINVPPIYLDILAWNEAHSRNI